MESYKRHAIPICCYKITEHDNKITTKKIEIWNYKPVVQYGGFKYYFDGKQCGISTYRCDNVSDSKFNRLVNMKYFTFDNDEDAIFEKIKQDLVEAVESERIKLNRLEKRLYLWNNCRIKE